MSVQTAADLSWGVVAIGNVAGVTVELVESEDAAGNPIYELMIDAAEQWWVNARVDGLIALQLLRGFLSEQVTSIDGSCVTLGYLDGLRVEVVRGAEADCWGLRLSGRQPGLAWEQRWPTGTAPRVLAAVSEALDSAL